MHPAVAITLMVAGVWQENALARNVLSEAVTATVVFALSARWYRADDPRNAAMQLLDRDLRTPVPDALATIRIGVERIVEVSDEEIEEAMRVLFSTTHNVAEGAGAASLAALLKDREHSPAAVAAIVLTGANVDPSPFAQILGAEPGRTTTE